jgi:hypothetical protein
MKSIGSRIWAIPEGYIPQDSEPKSRELESHETACVLNVGDHHAHVRITIYFSDREPLGPFEIEVPARRTRHVRFNDLKGPGEVPKGTDYSSVIESDVPIVVQHTRLDSRSSKVALLTTLAFDQAS